MYMPYSAASFVEFFGGGATRGIDCNITTSIYFLLNALNNISTRLENSSTVNYRLHIFAKVTFCRSKILGG